MIYKIQDRIVNRGDAMIAAIRSDLVSQGKRASGTLVSGTRGESRIVGSNVQYVGKAPTYYEFVDQGRRPGTPPPISPIKKWVSQKGLPHNPYAVAKSIGKKGIKPTKIYTNAVERFKKDLNLQEVVVKDITEEIRKLNFK